MQAQGMFSDNMYTRLIAIINMAVKQALLTNDTFEIEFVSLMLHSIPFMFLSLSFCLLLILLKAGTVISSAHCILYMIFHIP